MAEKQFTANGVWKVGFDAAAEKGFRTVAYSVSHPGGTLSGGTIQIKSSLSENVQSIPLSDAKLWAGKVDDNGDVVQQVTFQSAGALEIVLSGATAPNVWIAAL